MLELLARNLDTAACLTISFYLIKLQSQKNAIIITTSMATFGFIYILLRYTGLFKPPKQLNPHVEEEWRSRIVRVIHAIVLVIGSLLSFSEWPHYPDHDGWTVTNPNVYYYPELFTSIFVGYLQYDMIWFVKHREEHSDAASFIHHILYIAIGHYVLWGRFFFKAFAWLSFGELSTPFLHCRWFLAVTDRKQNKWYSFHSYLFALAFLFTRVFCFGLGLLDMWLSKYIWSHLPYGLYGVFIGVHLGLVLNLFWGAKVVGALMKRLKKKAKQN